MAAFSTLYPSITVNPEFDGSTVRVRELLSACAKNSPDWPNSRAGCVTSPPSETVHSGRLGSGLPLRLQTVVALAICSMGHGPLG